MNTFPQEFQLHIDTTGYRVSNITSVDTVTKQHSALSLLRKHALQCNTYLIEESNRIFSIVNCIKTTNFRTPLQRNSLFIDSHHGDTSPSIYPSLFHLRSESQADQLIRSYQPLESRANKPIIQHGDSLWQPKNPSTDYISPPSP